MLSTEIARQIRGTSISEQIEIIELILHSLRTKFETKNESSRKPFRVRKFGLGGEAHADRNEMYSERGLEREGIEL